MLIRKAYAWCSLISRLTPCAIILLIFRLTKLILFRLRGRIFATLSLFSLVKSNPEKNQQQVAEDQPLSLPSTTATSQTGPPPIPSHSGQSQPQPKLRQIRRNSSNLSNKNFSYHSSHLGNNNDNFDILDRNNEMANKLTASPHILPGVLAIVLPLSLIVWVIHYLLPFRSSESELSPLRCFLSIFIPSLILYNAAKNKKLDAPAMLTAFVMGFVETLSNLCMIATTVAFFLAGTRATKYKAKLKEFDEDEGSSGGRRNWIQVISNGGVGMEISILLLIEKGPANELPINFPYDYFPTWLSIAFLGSVACACGDTLASELAPALSSAQPRLITSPFTRVPKGTNGGVTVLGLLCSALGGFICGLTYYIFTLICINREILLRSPPQWPLLIVGTIAGLLGSLIDSIIGATVQFSGYEKSTGKIVSKSRPGVVWISGSEILDNHSVNLMSTLITALVTPYFGRFIWANL